MGIPYSKQINEAFEQVTPLVAEGFEVLQTTRNISILLAIIQVLTVLLQFVTVTALVALLISVNPDLEGERKALVTPVLSYLASWAMLASGHGWALKLVAWIVFWLFIGICGYAAYYFSGNDVKKAAEVSSDEMAEGAKGDEDNEQEAEEEKGKKKEKDAK